VQGSQIQIEIRECTRLDEFTECVQIQREVFALPESELSPVRHLIVTKNAGGEVLGAFDGDYLAGFVLSVPAFWRGERAFYSHMTAVRARYQSLGVGAKLKWEQRNRSLAVGVKFIKWTFEPVKARNAFFNLEKLGAVAREYKPDFYGTDYAGSAIIGSSIGLPSDRLFAAWHLDSGKVTALAAGHSYETDREPEAMIEIMGDWLSLVKTDSEAALAEQRRIRTEFEAAFDKGFVAKGFRRGDRPAYLLYKE
jgi:predicted GNAT superfamily acetyltransferase